MLLIVRSLCNVDTAAAETLQSTRDECRVFLMDSWRGRCNWEDQRERRIQGQWPDAAEEAEERFAELSVVDEVEKDVVGRAEDGQSQLNQGGPTGRFGTAGLTGHFIQELKHCGLNSLNRKTYI